MYYKTTILNRPISPHLSVYDSQITSLTSIWHRISGVLLIFITIGFNIWLKLVFYFSSNYILMAIQIENAYFIYLIISFLFLYHSLNGIRNVLWSLSYGFRIQNIKISFYILCFFCIFIFNLI
uniref:succinate dehydrogenase subunit 3 n=1 Tax=Hypnea nidifica TaxID=673448 RepID=UPI00300329EB|nr:succinate dehydrogenase subunit 3 [Hypnea nidifica]